MQNKRTVMTYCSVCEHSCGMQVAAQGNEILEIKGLEKHPYSKGFLCPKGFAAKEIWAAPDRLKTPLKKDNGKWSPVSWDEANCNMLTDDEARDPVSGFPGLKSSLCRIKKA